MKRVRTILVCVAAAVAILLLVVWQAMLTPTPQKYAGEALGLDLTGAKLLTAREKEPGFFGDGVCFYVFELADDGVLEQIRADPQWKVMPMDRHVTALLYGFVEGTTQIGPYLTAEGKPLLPEIENGFYWFVDRHTQAEPGQTAADTLQRASLNFSAGVYDADARILYFGMLDT